MRNKLGLFLALSILYYENSFGQQQQTKALDTLKSYYSRVNSVFQEYEEKTKFDFRARSSDDNERMEELLKSLLDACAVGAPYYEYLKAKGGINKDTLAKYNISKICKHVDGLKNLETLKKYKDSIHGKDETFNKILDSIKNTEQPEKFEELTQQLNELKKSLYDNCQKSEKLIEHLKSLAILDQSEIAKHSPAAVCSNYKGLKPVEKEDKKFIIVGDGDPVNADSLFTNNLAKETFYNAIGAESATQLGAFKIPEENFEISLYVEGHLKRKPNSIKKGSDQFVTLEKYFELISRNKEIIKKNQKKKIENNNKPKNIAKTEMGKVVFREDKFFHGRQLRFALEEKNNLKKIGRSDLPSKVLFKSISFEIKDGGLVDIRLITEDKNTGIQMYFESRAPVSLLNYTWHADRSFLYFSNKFKDKWDKEGYEYKILEHLRIRVTDVLSYDPKIGNNYVPEDLALTLPKNPSKEKSDDKPRSYQLINDSSLKNILDLRAYTDFLGLFSDEANGLFQLDGSADFFLNPFNFNRSSIYLFKKVTPYVRYSRLEEGNDFIQTEIKNDSIFNFDNDRLELLEKSNLEFGIDFNIFSFRLFKESPFWASLHVPINYYTTKVRPLGNEDNTNDFNFRTLAYGLGLAFELKRLNNFGLNIGTSIKEYSFLGDYEDITDTSGNRFEEPSKFQTHSVEAEIFYYPNNSRTQSIFLRMRGFRDIKDGDASFYQLQFGYRFTLGAGNIKAKD